MNLLANFPEAVAYSFNNLIAASLQMVSNDSAISTPCMCARTLNRLRHGALGHLRSAIQLRSAEFVPANDLMQHHLLWQNPSGTAPMYGRKCIVHLVGLCDLRIMLRSLLTYCAAPGRRHRTRVRSGPTSRWYVYVELERERKVCSCLHILCNAWIGAIVARPSAKFRH
jgi:hypothetical protein